MKYFLTCLIIVFCLGFAGCNNNETSDDPETLSKDELKEVLNDQKQEIIKDNNEDLVEMEKLFPEDFVSVCDLQSVQGAADYNDSKSGMSPIYLFTRNAESDPYILNKESLPADWSPSWEESETVELVACLDLGEKEVNETCKYQVSGSNYRLELMDAKYEVNLFEAASGEIVASTTLELEGEEDCPDEAVFDKEVKWDLPDYSESLEEFLEEYVE